MQKSNYKKIIIITCILALLPLPFDFFITALRLLFADSGIPSWFWVYLGLLFFASVLVVIALIKKKNNLVWCFICIMSFVFLWSPVLEIRYPWLDVLDSKISKIEAYIMKQERIKREEESVREFRQIAYEKAEKARKIRETKLLERENKEQEKLRKMQELKRKNPQKYDELIRREKEFNQKSYEEFKKTQKLAAKDLKKHAELTAQDPERNKRIYDEFQRQQELLLNELLKE